MKLVKVEGYSSQDKFDEFYKTSAFTFEGIVINEGLNMLEDFLVARDYSVAEKDRKWYWFTGKLMNDIYGLTGDNAYPDDLTFLVIPEYYNPMVKIQLGARWFDDIVDNNARNERGE